MSELQYYILFKHNNINHSQTSTNKIQYYALLKFQCSMLDTWMQFGDVVQLQAKILILQQLILSCGKTNPAINGSQD
jgi:hypothetical protein